MEDYSCKPKEGDIVKFKMGGKEYEGHVVRETYPGTREDYWLLRLYGFNGHDDDGRQMTEDHWHVRRSDFAVITQLKNISTGCSGDFLL